MPDDKKQSRVCVSIPDDVLADMRHIASLETRSLSNYLVWLHVKYKDQIETLRWVNASLDEGFKS